MPRDIDLSDILNAFRADLLSNLHTMMPGKVLRYDPVNQVADVQPLIKHVFWAPTVKDDVNTIQLQYESYPAIPRVPVMFPGSSQYVVAWPLNVGDQVILDFSEASLDEVLATAQESSPVDIGRHKLRHCVCYPKRPPQPSPSTDPGVTGNALMVVGKENGTQIRIDGAGTVTIDAANIKLGAGATDFVALASKVKSDFDTLQAAFDNHTHATAGTGTPSAPIPLPTFLGTIPVGTLPGVASSKTKSE